MVSVFRNLRKNYPEQNRLGICLFYALGEIARMQKTIDRIFGLTAPDGTLDYKGLIEIKNGD